MKTNRSSAVVVVGAGNAGLTAVETLKEAEPGMSVLLVDREEVYPYKRTKVSKKIALGYHREDFAVKDSRWYLQTGVDLRIASQVVELQPDKKILTLEGPSGRELVSYGDLILASGAKAVVPPGSPSGGWSVVRTAADGLNLRQAVQTSRLVAVAGLGVLGVEIAQQMTALGKEVLLLGNGPRPLENLLDRETSRSLETALEAAGVRLQKETRVLKVHPGENGVVLETDKGRFSVDHAVLCLGIQPEIELAQRAGLGCNRGIQVDKTLAASAPHIYAAGDAAEHPGERLTGLWHAAEHQGRLAAQGILGSPGEHTLPPYRLKCEVFGGYWFSAGEVNALPEGPREGPESWEINGILWRPRFRQGRLASLAGAAPQGMDKALAKGAQRAVLEGLDPLRTREILESSR